MKLHGQKVLPPGRHYEGSDQGQETIDFSLLFLRFLEVIILCISHFKGDESFFINSKELVRLDNCLKEEYIYENPGKYISPILVPILIKTL